MKPVAARASVLSNFQSGFSLIELMVAITLGMLIVAALIALFLNINRTNTEMAKTNSQIENGRFAMQILQSDIVHGGFWGGYVPQFDDLTLTTAPTDAPTAVPNPCLDYATPWTAAHITNLIGIPVQAYGNTPPSGGGCVTNLATNKQANTDVLVVRHAETCIAGSGGNCEADIVGKLYFQSSLSYHLPIPRPIPEPNCPAGRTADAAPYILNTAGFGTLNKKDCDTDVTEKRKFISSIYYIRDYAKTVGDGIPTLMLSQFDGLAHQEAVPLIEGIEGFRVELGIDNLSKTGAAVNYTAAINWLNPANLTTPTNRGDGVPDGAFVRCTDAIPCTAAQLTNAVAVKLYVLARADKVSPGYTDSKTYALGSSTLGPYGDGFKRHVFSTTVRLNNISGRRETP
ncbi:MAG: pilus assembly protein PilW [Methylotenera sp. RIFCSPLOWO2_02_FULL_45_14]|nr:MAG: pilus assembly protein PilW [Methylotenera sp. RIFCSPLOWO2_02_FULL_45_14]